MEHSISSDFIRGHIDTIILHSIIDSDKYAQQISDTIEQKSQNKYQINQATLYSSLKRLESLGYVKSYWNDAPDGRRKFIKITDSGKEFLQENMSVWAYSRGIIDKLMDVQPETVVKYVEIEKIVEKPVQSPILQPVIQPLNIEKTDKNENQPVETKKFDLNDTATNDIAFRSILSELIKSNDVQDKINPENQSETDNVEIKTEKLKLEETIDDIEYIPQNTGDYSKIDFTDIVENAKKDDLKVKVSSKSSTIKVGSIYINLVNLVSSLLIFALTLGQFFYANSKFSVILGFTTVSNCFIIGALTIFPIITLIKYLKKSNKTSQKLFADTIFVAFIVAFNVVLIAFALNLLLNIDFNAFETVVYSLYLPIILAIDSILYYVFRFFLSKLKLFKYTV